MFEIFGQIDYATALRRAFGIRGAIAPIGAETISPTMEVGPSVTQPFGPARRVRLLMQQTPAASGSITQGFAVVPGMRAIVRGFRWSSEVGGGKLLVDWGRCSWTQPSLGADGNQSQEEVSSEVSAVNRGPLQIAGGSAVIGNTGTAFRGYLAQSEYVACDTNVVGFIDTSASLFQRGFYWKVQNLDTVSHTYYIVAEIDVYQMDPPSVA